MADRAAKQTATKGSASAAEMAARPFQCEWHEGCSKSFNRKSDLQRHYRIHTNERPYACDHKLCNKTFIQRSALTVHRRTHTGDKPHKCPFLGCGKCFSDSSSLARHRRIHTNDKPYICRNQRCKKAFCRKTTMTKHIRKEHPSESVQDDQDAEYSDVEQSDDEQLEEENEAIKEEVQGLYQEPGENKSMPVARPAKYHANLWSLPAQSVQRPTPLRLDSSFMSRSDAAVHEIKLERTSSVTPQRSLTDPCHDSRMHSSDYSFGRSDTMSNSVPTHASMPHNHISGSIPPQYQLRSSENNVGIWSPQTSMQNSPTSLTHSSPISAAARSQPMYTSQPFQLQNVEMSPHEQIHYVSQQGCTIPTSIPQPLSELPVHEIHLDERPPPYQDMISTPVQQEQYAATSQQVPQPDLYQISRDVSQQVYGDSASVPTVPPYQDDIPPTPVPPQQSSQFAIPEPGVPYQQPQFMPLESYPVNSHDFASNAGLYQYTDGSIDWWKFKMEGDWQLPSDRIQELEWR